MDDANIENNEDNGMRQRGRAGRSGDEFGEAAGGISGVVVGAAIGSLGGPVGTVIGGIAGAVGGWWAGRTVAEAAQQYTASDDAVYRNHYENSVDGRADPAYEDVSLAYRLGHIAARNPDYRGRPFTEIEPDLERGWNQTAISTSIKWNSIRACVNDAYDRNANTIEHQRLREEANIAADAAARRLDNEADVHMF